MARRTETAGFRRGSRSNRCASSTRGWASRAARSRSCSTRSSPRKPRAPAWGSASRRPSCRNTAVPSRSTARKVAAPPCFSTSRWRSEMAKGDSSTRAQSKGTLLVVDDERSLRFSIGEWARDEGFAPLEAATGREALEALREQGVDAVVLDLKLGDEDGLKVLKELRENDPALPVVMLTGHGTVEQAVRAIQLGAYDFMLKPPDLAHLGVVLDRALEHARLRQEVTRLREGATGRLEIIGGSEGLRTAMSRLERAAKASASTVLIHGETGSGKELMARYLHDRSARAGEPFVEHYIARFCRELGRPTARLHPAALERMQSYRWPGNVRELRNIIERVVLLEAEEEIRSEHLPSELTLTAGGVPSGGGDPFPAGVVRPLAEVEKLAIEHALRVSGGNKTRAATLLGIARQTLRTKLKEYAIADDGEEGEAPPA